MTVLTAQFDPITQCNPWVWCPAKGKTFRPFTLQISDTSTRSNQMRLQLSANRVKSGAWVGSVAEGDRDSGLYGLPELAFEKYEDFERAVMREVRAKLRAAHAATEVKLK